MPRKIRRASIALLLLSVSISAWASNRPWVKAVHCPVANDDEAQLLLGQLANYASLGLNTVFIEVGYAFEWQRHPELRHADPITLKTARAIAAQAKKLKLDLVPEIACIGHQSWEEWTSILLETYPELDETPGLYPKNADIYCRSWCTRNPQVYPIVFDLIDELYQAFEAKAIHIGLDEIFLIGEDACPRCRGQDRSVLLAEAIKKLYDHCVTKRHLVLYMWADRLLNGQDPAIATNPWGYDYANNDTYRAVDMIPKDIILCDWHYDLYPNYPSYKYLLSKGFRVLSVSFNDPAATKAFIADTLAEAKNPRALGHIYTLWGTCTLDNVRSWPPLVQTIKSFGRE